MFIMHLHPHLYDNKLNNMAMGQNLAPWVSFMFPPLVGLTRGGMAQEEFFQFD